ncbi:hypothetical protein PV416_05715 [Streptomyces ipomoeae]|uniref:hypothetical protein n=1 Tax=Streptomyces ipomoeae TaxID=103232 RepID=UPI0029A8EE8F|nr:hypothetical protein [Streptomyces ipomoeae]MDX2820600.1 hypothetical protein [Streptomyces ipomoeae]MDX2873079.1 hypothetical protein [Streptomyces ipomoeae]
MRPPERSSTRAHKARELLDRTLVITEIQKIRKDEVKSLRADVDALKERCFPLSVIGALATTGTPSVIGLLLTR